MRGDGGLFKQPKSPFWWMRYSLRGRQYRESTKILIVEGPGAEASQREALKVLKAKLKQVHADQIGAKTFVTPRAERITIDELLDALITDLEIREKFSPEARSQMKPLRQTFGNRPAVKLTDRDVQEFIKAERALGKANATINRETQFLKQAFRLNRVLGPGPAIPHLSEKDNVRRGFLDAADFERVVAELPADLQDFARWGYLTGWRKGTIRRLDWASVDARAMTLDVPGSMTKNGRPVKMVLNGPYGEIIRRRLALRSYRRADGTSSISNLVFYREGSRGIAPGTPVKRFDKAWEEACEKAGVGKILFHDLRRSAARNLRRAGVDQAVSMTITGHRTDSMFRRYNITDERDLEAAVDQISAYLEKQKSESSKVVAFEPRYDEK